MGTLETFFLIRAIKWLLRWLASNEKNRKIVEDRIMDEVADAIHKALEDSDV